MRSGTDEVTSTSGLRTKAAISASPTGNPSTNAAACAPGSSAAAYPSGDGYHAAHACNPPAHEQEERGGAPDEKSAGGGNYG